MAAIQSQVLECASDTRDALGITAENVADEYGFPSEESGCLCGAVAGAGPGRHGERALSPKRSFRLECPTKERPAEPRRRRRTPPTRDHDREVGRPSAGVSFGRLGDRRKQLGHQRRIRRPPRRVRGGDRATRSHPHRPGRRLGDRRRSSPHHGDWTDSRHRTVARQDGYDDLGHGRHRTQRSVCQPVARLREGVRPPR